MSSFKRYLESFISLWQPSFAKRCHTCIHKRRTVLVDECGRPTKKLFDLLSYLDVKHEGNLESIVNATQKSWLRPVGMERWEVQDTLSHSKPKLAKYLCDLGFHNEIEPLGKSYQYCILLGASLDALRSRLQYLAKLVNNGLTFEQLVILTGARSLDPKVESIERMLNIANSSLASKEEWVYTGHEPKTETEMIELVLSQALLPQSLEEAQLLIVDTPAKHEDGKKIRPTTRDTVHYWLQSKPMPGKCLVISSQPYIQYQDLVVRKTLPASFFVETVGPKVARIERCDIYLDTIARILYEEQGKVYKSQNCSR